MNFEAIQEEIKKINFLDEYNKIDFQKVKEFILKDEKRACKLYFFLTSSLKSLSTSRERRSLIFILNYFFKIFLYKFKRHYWIYRSLFDGRMG